MSLKHYNRSYNKLVWHALQTPPSGNKSQYEEIGIPVALLSYKDMLDISKVIFH